MGKHCSKRGSFAGVLTLKWRTQEIPGMDLLPSGVGGLCAVDGHIVSGMAKEGGGAVDVQESHQSLGLHPDFHSWRRPESC